MKIAVTTETKDLNAPLDPRFGRAKGFFVHDTESGEDQYIDNAQNLSLPQGAGIQSAMNVANTGAKAVITGHVGPKAFMALDKGGIAVYLTSGMTVQEALKAFEADSLTKAQGPDKDGHW